MLENVTLTHLRALVAVSKTRSYAHAAAQLNYSPPAVHQQIRSLERALGLALVHRESSPVRLTADGQALLAGVEALLDRADALAQLARGLRAPDRVTLGAGRNTGVFLLMPVLGSLAESDPELDVDLHVMGAEALVEQVISGSLDVAVSGMMSRHLAAEVRRTHQLVLVPWACDVMVVVANGGVSCERLLSHPLGPRIFVPPYGAHASAAWEREPPLEVAGVEHWRFVEMETSDGAKSAVANGLGLGVLPLSAVRDDVSLGRLRVVGRLGVRPARIHLLHRRPSLLTDAPRRLIRGLLAGRPESRAAGELARTYPSISRS